MAGETSSEERLIRVSRVLHAAADPAGFLCEVSALAREEFPATEVCEARFVGRSPNAKVCDPAHFDTAQRRAGAGPALDAARGCVVRAEDLTTDTRWPLLHATAAQRGLRSALCLPLTVSGGTSAVLGLYSRRAGAFDAGCEAFAGAFAEHAGLALGAVAAQANLRDALEGRDVIGQAKGILMERFKLNSDDAFRLLVDASQHTQTKLRTVAERLCLTGEIATGQAGAAPAGDGLTAVGKSS
jgi:GAF domain-containing protein